MPGHVRPFDFSSANVQDCAATRIEVTRPSEIDTMIWYPALEDSWDTGRSISAWMSQERRFPLILYAHAKRRWLTCPEQVPAGIDPGASDVTRDFTRVDHMLSHIASWGFVIAAPDLGWLLPAIETGDIDTIDDASHPGTYPRARILIALHEMLVADNDAMFLGRMNPVMLGLFGHSSGGAACLAARRKLDARILGLVAPGVSQLTLAEANYTTLVIAGTNDTAQGANPDEVYARLTGARFLVRLGGANHLGYTELCTSDNRTCLDLDPAGDISRLVQQETAAAYLTAAARSFLNGDAGMLSYLTNNRQTGAELYLPSLEVRWQ
jgi:hypothetical protein